MLDPSQKDAMRDIDKLSMISGMFFVFGIGSICIHGKELLRQNLQSIKNTLKNLTLKSRCARYLKSLYWNNRKKFLECLKSAWKVLHGTVISGQ